MKKLTLTLAAFAVAASTMAQSSNNLTTVSKISNTTLQDATLGSADHFGNNVTNIGDLDKDGVPDLGVSASDNNDGGIKRGAFYVLFMKTDGTVKKYQKISQTQGNLGVTFSSDNYKFGYSIAPVGDLDGDGAIDLAVGAVGAKSYAGTAWILFMKTDGTVKTAKELTGLPLIGGDIFGCSMASIGDLDKDGVADIAVGAYSAGGGYGAVFVIFLKSDGTVKSYKEITSSMNGFNATLKYSDLFGVSVAGAGDWNNDNVNDILVGATGTDGANSNEGAVYILYMNSTGTVSSYKRIDNSQSNFGVLVANANFGVSVCAIPDMNQDGYKDMMVGSHTDNGGRGAVYILNMDGNKDIKSYSKVSSSTSQLSGKLDPNDYFGSSSAYIQLSNGIPSFAIGAPLDDDVSTDAGAIYILNYSALVNGILSPEPSSLKLNLYPNPSHGELTISVANVESDKVNVRITDLSGRTIKFFQNLHLEKSTSRITLDESELISGSYLVTVESGNSSATNLIFLQH